MFSLLQIVSTVVAINAHQNGVTNSFMSVSDTSYGSRRVKPIGDQTVKKQTNNRETFAGFCAD